MGLPIKAIEAYDQDENANAENEELAEVLWRELGEITHQDFDGAGAVLAFDAVEGEDEVEIAFQVLGGNWVMHSAICFADDLDETQMKAILDAQFGMVRTGCYAIGINEYDAVEITLAQPLADVTPENLENAIKVFIIEAINWRRRIIASF